MEIKSAPPGPASLFTMAAFGRPDENFLKQLQLRNQHTQQQLSQVYGFDATSFFKSSSSFFNMNTQLVGMKEAENLIMMGKVETSSALEYNVFTPIRSEEDFVKANFVQRTYLMANPLVRQLFLDGVINGYKNNYTNNWGSSIGFEDPVFRQAVSGMSQSSYMELPDDVDEAYFECLDDPIEGLQPLTALEQSNLMQAWKLQAVLHAEGIDTTDPDLKPYGD